MDAIKNYLESMFMNLPNTPEVLKAKRELGQMMEDKYTELVEEGRTDNEAVGQVIAEFGNLEDLADELGIRGFVNPKENMVSRKHVPMEDVKAFLKYNSSRAFKMALGVLLCILAPISPMLFDGLFMESDLIDALAVTMLFVIVAVAVALFISTGMQTKQWEYLKKTPCTIDMATVNFVQEQQDGYRGNYSILITLGIVLCVLSVVPAILLDSVASYNPFLENLGGILLFAFVGAGVFMMVLANTVNGGYRFLLQLNDIQTVGGSYVEPQYREPKYESKALEEIMSVYWLTVTCVYLIWSFLSFDWYITWIIWPVSVLIHTIIKVTCKKK